jgi:hypothetical protein
MFEVGDKVKCINNTGYYSNLFLQINKIYTVKEIDELYNISLLEIANKTTLKFSPNKFELVGQEKMQKFEYGDIVKAKIAHNGLAKGQTYKVYCQNGNLVYLSEDDLYKDIGWFEDNFELVSKFKDKSTIEVKKSDIEILVKCLNSGDIGRNSLLTENEKIVVYNCLSMIGIKLKREEKKISTFGI